VAHFLSDKRQIASIHRAAEKSGLLGNPYLHS
jgi:hypothetical protein